LSTSARKRAMPAQHESGQLLVAHPTLSHHLVGHLEMNGSNRGPSPTSDACRRYKERRRTAQASVERTYNLLDELVNSNRVYTDSLSHDSSSALPPVLAYYWRTLITLQIKHCAESCVGHGTTPLNQDGSMNKCVALPKRREDYALWNRGGMCKEDFLIPQAIAYAMSFLFPVWHGKDVYVAFTSQPDHGEPVLGL